ncbi:hypothetical protein F5878DRAFT_670340 [Lentinula raphanica]|uniref:DUF7053 domain-containing protein n=1 Tax=Lentinula raphanica TaxID=153919 RepID=A0AA38PLH0_9AGAR|nr:hypothetical protein F5878DRAFT_670340 [Lentinula raphanica]
MVSGWPFFLESSKTFVKTFPAPDGVTIDGILRILHDPPVLVGINPLVTKCEVLDPSKPNVYTIHDALPILGLFTLPIVYTVNFELTNDGTDTEVEAGMGTTIAEQWRVKQKEETQDVEISEKFNCRNLEAPRGRFHHHDLEFHAYAGKRLNALSHAEVLDRLANKVIEEAKGRTSTK